MKNEFKGHNPVSLPEWVFKGKLPYLLLLALCIFLYLPGINSIPPTDRDEARFVQASRQMMETGDYTRIFFQQKPRHKKPAGAYWLQTLSVRLFSEKETKEIWSYRIPSFLAACFVVLFFFAASSRILGREKGFLSSVILGSSLVLIAEAHLAKADASLLAAVTVVQCILGWLYFDWKENKKTAPVFLPYLMWIALGAGILIKGPVLPAVFGLTILYLSFSEKNVNWIKVLHPFLGPLLTVLIVAPWFIAVQDATSGHFIQDALQGDILPKLLGVHESHGGPPGFYTLTAFATFWPWSFFLIPALFWLFQNRRSNEGRFIFAWLVPAWIALEIVPTKLPHYSMPLFPALAMCVACLLFANSFKLKGKALKLEKAGRVLWYITGGALALAVIVVPFVFGQGFSLISLVITAGISWFLYRVQKTRADAAPLPQALYVFGVAAFITVFLGGVFPYLDNFWMGRKLRDSLQEELGDISNCNLILAGFHEPSAVFYHGTNTVLSSPEEAAGNMLKLNENIIVVSNKVFPNFQKSLANDSMLPEFTVEGFNYSKGKFRQLKVYTQREFCGNKTKTKTP